MFGISGIEFFIILAVGFLIFGPEELPRIGRVIGQALRMFNDARQEVEQVITTEILTPEDAHLLRDPLGMKGMRRDLEKTMKQLADPDYKPIPKGAGMRVSTDEGLAQTAGTATTAEASEPVEPSSDATMPASSLAETVDPDDVASIWGLTGTTTHTDANDSASPDDAVAPASKTGVSDAD